MSKPTTLTVDHVLAFLDRLAPPHLAEEWDNVGLLVGDRGKPIRRLMTCLTITPASAAEAIAGKAQLIVSHHPLPFHALKRLTTETTAGRLLLDLIAAGVAIYSAHTAFDSASEGINQRLARGLGLRGVAPLTPHPAGLGSGRWGWLEEPVALQSLVQRVKQFLSVSGLHYVGSPEHTIRSVAVACGAAGEMLDQAVRTGCDCLVLGETRFHTCLEAEAAGIDLILPGHFASERFALDSLAEVLAREFPAIGVWASREERDPLHWA